MPTDQVYIPAGALSGPADAPGNGAALPDSVKVSATPRFTPNQYRRLMAATGLDLSKLMADAANVMQACVWFALAEAGHHPTWEEAGDVHIEFEVAAADPFSDASVTTEPPSAATGG